MKTKITDILQNIEDGKKNILRNVNLTFPLPINEIINKGIHKDYQILDPEGDGVCEHYLQVFDDKIILNLNYCYQAPASNSDIVKVAARDAKEKIETLKQNLDLLCEKYDLSMDDLMNFVQENKND